MSALVYVAFTIILTVYGQLVIKWQVSNTGGLPVDSLDKIKFLFSLLTNAWVISAFLAAFFASISWMAALTKLQLNYAYPFMSLAFVLVFAFSAILFQETVTTPKVIGLLLVVIGITIASQG